MTKIKLFSFFIILIATFSLTSCDNEPVDPAISIPQNNPSTGNGTGTGTDGTGTDGAGTGGTTAGDYWPAALNNQWILSQNGVQQDPMKITSINVINGNTYYTFGQTAGQGTSGTSGSAVTRLRKDSGDYYLKMDDLTIDYGGGLTGVMTGYEMLLFEDNVDVGQTWDGTFTQTTTYNNPMYPVVSTDANYLGTMLEKGITMTVNGKTYTNVIKFRMHQSVSFMGSVTEANTDYWYGKDVGPIKSITYSAGTTTPQYTSELISYILN